MKIVEDQLLLLTEKKFKTILDFFFRCSIWLFLLYINLVFCIDKYRKIFCFKNIPWLGWEEDSAEELTG